MDATTTFALISSYFFSTFFFCVMREKKGLVRLQGQLHMYKIFGILCVFFFFILIKNRKKNAKNEFMQHNKLLPFVLL